MSADIWANCADNFSLVVLNGEAFRVVESQEKIATNELVDTLEEQALLEEMIEQTKPAIPETAQDLAYLLFTPFRYPPFKYGSRFGARFEPSLFYASRTLATALAEVAYYRLAFWFDMSEPPPSGKLKTQHIALSVKFYTQKGVKLQEAPFSKYEADLVNKSSYKNTQKLGTSMRKQGVEAFETISARDRDKGLNIGLFNPEVLTEKKPSSIVNILCATHADGVEFMDESREVYNYNVNDFLDNGVFPSLLI